MGHGTRGVRDKLSEEGAQVSKIDHEVPTYLPLIDPRLFALHYLANRLASIHACAVSNLYKSQLQYQSVKVRRDE